MSCIRLERSMLFVPATSSRMIRKAATSAADAVCIDLEDSVAPAEKAAARAGAIEAFGGHDFGGRVRMLRINGLETSYAYRDVIDAVEAVGDRIDVIMMPKCNGPEDVVFLDRLLTQVEGSKGFGRRIGIEAQIETASGFLYVREIARASSRLEALAFGPGDYSSSMRMPSAGIGEFDAADAAYPGHRWHAVMHAIVAAARANGLRCMDGPYAAYQDAAGFERSCRIARSLGFDGKHCIHPNQLEMTNQSFTPPDEEVAAARRVVAAYEAAASEGRGAASLDGKMIDTASIRMANTLLEQFRLSETNKERTNE